MEPSQPVRECVRSIRSSTAAKEFCGDDSYQDGEPGRKQQLTKSRELLCLPAPSEGQPASCVPSSAPELCSPCGAGGQAGQTLRGPEVGKGAPTAHSGGPSTFKPVQKSRTGLGSLPPDPGSVPRAVARPHTPLRGTFYMLGRGCGLLSESQFGSGLWAGKPCPVMGRI